MSQTPAAGADLRGKVVLVTGAARGQGRAHCEAFAAAGCDVIALDLCLDNFQFFYSCGQLLRKRFDGPVSNC